MHRISLGFEFVLFSLRFTLDLIEKNTYTINKSNQLLHSLYVQMMGFPYWSFVEKTSVKQSVKCKVCSNLQVFFSHLVIQTAPIVKVSGQVDIFVRSSGQAALWSDVPPIVKASGQVDIFVRSLG